jgi:TPR repeat protein
MEKEFSDTILLYRNNDYEQALNKFEKLADLGDAKSQHNLAVMHYKGQGIPQNFNKAYYWSIMSMLNGQKKSEILMKNNQKRVSNINKKEIESEVKDDLEKAINEGKVYAVIPLAKWYLTFPKKPDYNNSYLWLSVASALNIANSNKARNSIIKKIKNKDLEEIQNEANEIFNKMIKSKKITQME